MMHPTSIETGKASPYAYYVVGMLMVAYMLSFLDRVLLSLLIAPIQKEFDLGDTEIGLLMGFGFVIFYSVLGLPFGALADRSNRRNLMSAGILAWSVATSISGFMTSFAGLLGARAAVGVGEATLSPAAYSTISDRFPRERLGLAIGIYSAGVSIGGGLAMAFGGALVQWATHNSLDLPGLGLLTGWRLAMVVVGALGVPLALVMMLTVREAPRKGGQVKAPSFASLLSHVAGRPLAFGGVFLGFACAVVSVYIPFLWAPALFMRVHGMSVQEVGLTLGAIVGTAGVVGVLGSGALSDFLTRRGLVDAPVRVIFWAALAQIPILGGAYLVNSQVAALILLAVGMSLTTTASSLQGTAMQLMTPPRMRGRMMAIYLLFITLIGMGVGPLAIGLLSDHVFPGPKGLAPALAVVSTVALVFCGIILTVSRKAVRDCIVAEIDREASAVPAAPAE